MFQWRVAHPFPPCCRASSSTPRATCSRSSVIQSGNVSREDVHLRLLGLVNVRSVDKVSYAVSDHYSVPQAATRLTTLLVEVVEDRFCSLLVAGTKLALPRISEVHCAETERRHSQGGARREKAISLEGPLGRRSRHRHHSEVLQFTNDRFSSETFSKV